jgi:hypothetical protein
MRSDRHRKGSGGETVDSRRETKANSLTGGQEQSVKATGLQKSFPGNRGVLSALEVEGRLSFEFMETAIWRFARFRELGFHGILFRSRCP